MSTQGTCPIPTCPHRQRLHRAIEYYRAQQAEIARLRELLTRHARLGLRRFAEAEARHTLVGTTVWSENVQLRRDLRRLHDRLQTQAQIIAVLKTLLRAAENQPESQGVEP